MDHLDNQLDSGIPILSSSNYLYWKGRMQLLLKSTDSWYTISEPLPAIETDKWKHDNVTAKTFIAANVDRSLFMDLETAQAFWHLIRKIFEKRKMTLMTQFFAFHYNPRSTIRQHIERYKYHVLLMKNSNLLPEPFILKFKFLHSLPTRFESYIQSLETSHDSDLSDISLNDLYEGVSLWKEV